jgi:hypothetical protein
MHYVLMLQYNFLYVCNIVREIFTVVDSRDATVADL